LDNAKLQGGRMASAFVRRQVPGLVPRYEVLSTDAVVGMVSAGLGFSVAPKPRQPILDAYDLQVVLLDK
jgi:DNA-binding transcriptional LysR family regulator